MDYRRLNSVTVKDAFSQPSIDCLSGANGSSTLGIAFPYQQVALNRLPYIYTCIWHKHRLQNSPSVCVFKYARAVKQKVWNEAENRERDWGETLSRASHA